MRNSQNFWDKNAGRYDRFMRKDAAAYEQLYELLRGGAIGRIESLDAVENVAYWHYAHSYVRGNWRLRAITLFHACSACSMLRVSNSSIFARNASFFEKSSTPAFCSARAS